MFEVSSKEGFQMRADKSTFNSLPLEIIKKIFCDVGGADLFDMKSVCSFWRVVIQDILNIQEIEVPIEMYANAAKVVDIETNMMCTFQIYQAPCRIRNLINEKIILNSIGYHVLSLDEISFSEVLEKLECATTNEDFERETKVKEITASSWISTIIVMTEKDYSGRYIKNKSSRSKEEHLEFLKAKFRWYTFAADLGYSCIEGIVALYPDSRTFGIFYGFETQSPYNSDSNPENDFSYYNDFYYDETDWDLY